MKTNNTRRSLWISGLSLILCVAMLVGTTFAWFTATVSNKGNRIEAGTLDLELYKNTVDDDINGNETPVVPLSIPDEEATDWVNITSQDADDNYIFRINNWAPGDETTVYLAVKNAGSLALLYDIDLVVTDDSLASALTMQYTSKVSASTEAPDFANMPGSKDIAPLSSVLEGSSFPKKANLTTAGELEENEVEYIAVTITFMESAGDSYQRKAFEADFNITATQKKGLEGKNVAEKVVKAYNVQDIMDVPENSTVILMNEINEPNEDIDLTGNNSKLINLDLNGYTLTVNSITVESDKIGTIDIATNSGKINVVGTFEMNVPNAQVNINGVATATGSTPPSSDIVANEFVFYTAQHSLHINATLEARNNGPISIFAGRVVIGDGIVVRRLVIPDNDLGNPNPITIINNGIIGELENYSSATPNVENNGTINQLSGIDEEDLTGDGTIGDGNFSGGHGTPESPYLISNKDDLMNIGEPESGGVDGVDFFNRFVFKLTNDIDMQGTRLHNLGKFNGLLDGNGYSIKNAVFTSEGYVGSSSSFTVGLFRQVNGPAVGKCYEAVTEEDLANPCCYEINGKKYVITAGAIMNLTFDASCTFYSNIGPSLSPIGGNECTAYIINVKNYANIVAEGSSVIYIGGIVARDSGTGLVINCENYGDITFTGTAHNSMAVGGIASRVYGGSNGTYPDILRPYAASVYGCVNYGDIYVEGGDVGGIVGRTNGGNKTLVKAIINSANHGNVQGLKNVGGIIGRNIDDNILYLLNNENTGAVSLLNGGAEGTCGDIIGVANAYTYYTAA